MLDYVYGHDEVVASFVAQLIPSVRDLGFGNCRTIGVIEGGLLLAGIVYHNYQPDADVVQMSGAALPGHYWITRETMKRAYEYPFLGFGCQMVVNIVPADDARQLYMLSRFGYTFIPFPRLLGRERDGVICHLTREAWEASKFTKYLNRHQQPVSEAA